MRISPEDPWPKLLTWCLNINVDVLFSGASENSPSKDVHSYEYYDHKNRDYGDHTYSATAATFFGHEGPPCKLGIKLQGAIRGKGLDGVI
jgi:hypothetical protein